jgi:hypothetical protein
MKKVGNNHEVPLAWKEGREFRNKQDTFRTDGKTIRSYDLIIGYTCPVTGKKIVLDYTWPWNVSQTTTVHVNELKGFLLKRGVINVNRQPGEPFWTEEPQWWHPDEIIEPDPDVVERFKRIADSAGGREGW